MFNIGYLIDFFIKNILSWHGTAFGSAPTFRELKALEAEVRSMGPTLAVQQKQYGTPAYAKWF